MEADLARIAEEADPLMLPRLRDLAKGKAFAAQSKRNDAIEYFRANVGNDPGGTLHKAWLARMTEDDETIRQLMQGPLKNLQHEDRDPRIQKEAKEIEEYFKGGSYSSVVQPEADRQATFMVQ